MTTSDDRPRCVHGRLVTSACADCAADHALAQRLERAESDERNGVVHRSTAENQPTPDAIADMINAMFGGRLDGVRIVQASLECSHAREVKQLKIMLALVMAKYVPDGRCSLLLEDAAKLFGSLDPKSGVKLNIAPLFDAATGERKGYNLWVEREPTAGA